MTSPARVSVCIPTYNGEVSIAEAMTSVLEQTFADFELLLVDDGSSDRTVEIIRSFQDSRLRLYQNERRLGIPGNWNRCLALAAGEHVCLFHQDDVMLPDNLQRKCRVLADHPDVSFVHSAVEVVNEESAPTKLGAWVEAAAEDFIQEGLLYFRKLLLHGDCVCAPAVVARRKTLLDLGGFDEELGYACDYEMWMKLCVEGRVAFLAQPLVRYRWHEKNASHAYRFERGVEETVLARSRALQLYKERTRRREEGEILEDAVEALAVVKRWVAELEEGKTWLEEQAQRWRQTAEEREQVIQEQKAWITELEGGKAWLEEQLRNWRRVAEEQKEVVLKQQEWIGELEKGRAWLEEQVQGWRQTAEVRETMIQEQRNWIAELEKGKAWLETQWRAWQAKAERR